MALLALMPLILAFAADFTAAQQNRGNFTLQGCPTLCGDIDVPYPFGFSPGCYRPGFQLTCTTSHNTTSLFIVGSSTAIEVTEIFFFGNQLIVSVPFIVSSPDGNSRNASWTTALTGTPYTISSMSNNLTATGCGIVASLMNPDTGATLATCASFCGREGINTSSCDVGFGCCSATIPRGLRSYSIRLDSQETESGGGAVAAVAISSIDAGLLKESTRVEVVLDWAISDANSCEAAKRDALSYACSNFSQCIDTPGSTGYTCDCISILDDGNPYVPNSCPEVVTLRSPRKGCPRKCGDIDVPFPFGFKRGCYRHENFSLSCTMESNTPFLNYNKQFNVTQINIGEGRMSISNTEQDALDDANIYRLNNITGEVGWVAGFGSCQEARNQRFYACISTQSECFVNPTSDASIEAGYSCRCKHGYDGNPYIHDGCQDVDECSDPHKHGCYGTCTNTLGSFTCSCQLQMGGNPSKNCFPPKKKSVVLGAIIGLSLGLGLILLILCGVILYKKLKQRIRQKTKEKYFHKNRGLLLQQRIASNEIANERVKIFSLEDLEEATNKFDETRIKGSGGHGTVYKGILSDQRVVAIKKSKIVVQEEIEQFINEVVILSTINHRNVVKLFGCCLETEVPLLVYEFITNGSLSDHLHLEENKSSLSWDDRLRIASETAGALAYLHSEASTLIYHRDVKTSNILLDDNFSAKVSDFGASRSLPLDKTRVLTAIQGTFGYLDPEYYHTGELTAKSDVYSFGVILVELLTGEMPNSFSKFKDDRNLCMSFLLSLRENRLVEILEPRVIDGALTEELDAVAKLAEACLNLRGEDRPTMKEVDVILESLIKTKKQKQLIRQQNQEESKFYR